MNRWSFNRLLLNRLADVLDISGTAIAKRCGITQQVFSRYTTNEVDVSVQVLIRICNALRMPIRFFVSEDNNHIIPDRETATVPADRWHPIDWDCQAVEKTFGDGEDRIYWKDVAEAMGVSMQKPHDRFLLVTRFPMTDFLNVCSRLNISPFTFLIDENSERQKEKCTKRKTDSRRADSRENEALRSEILALTRKIDGMNDTVADLISKYEDLLGRHNALLDRHNELERKYNDRFGYERPLMAAETDTDRR